MCSKEEPRAGHCWSFSDCFCCDDVHGSAHPDSGAAPIPTPWLAFARLSRSEKKAVNNVADDAVVSKIAEGIQISCTVGVAEGVGGERGS